MTQLGTMMPCKERGESIPSFVVCPAAAPCRIKPGMASSQGGSLRSREPAIAYSSDEVIHEVRHNSRNQKQDAHQRPWEFQHQAGAQGCLRLAVSCALMQQDDRIQTR